MTIITTDSQFLKHQSPLQRIRKLIHPTGWIDNIMLRSGFQRIAAKHLIGMGVNVLFVSQEDLSMTLPYSRSKKLTNDQNLQTLCRASCNSSKKNREAAAILKDKITVITANDELANDK